MVNFNLLWAKELGVSGFFPTPLTLSPPSIFFQDSPLIMPEGTGGAPGRARQGARPTLILYDAICTGIRIAGSLAGWLLVASLGKKKEKREWAIERTQAALFGPSVRLGPAAP